MVLAFLISCICAHRWTDTCALHSVRTTTTTGAILFKGDQFILVAHDCWPLRAVVVMSARDDADGGTGSARRRRERRLRSMLRHEQQSIRLALATFTHHSAQRQKMARAGERVRVEQLPRRQVHSTSFSTSTKHLPPGAPGLTGSRRSGLRGPAAHRGPDHRCTDARCSCAADGATAVGRCLRAARYPGP